MSRLRVPLIVLVLLWPIILTWLLWQLYIRWVRLMPTLSLLLVGRR